MLDTKDIDTIRSLLNEVKTDLQSDIQATESNLIKQIDFVQKRANERINEVQHNLEELKQYNRISKLEHDNTALLLQMYKDLQGQVNELKQRIA